MLALVTLLGVSDVVTKTYGINLSNQKKRKEKFCREIHRSKKNCASHHVALKVKKNLKKNVNSLIESSTIHFVSLKFPRKRKTIGQRKGNTKQLNQKKTCPEKK